MSTELIERLRDLANLRHDDLSIGDEAADRIEQLEAEIAELVAALDALLHTPAGHSTERNIAIAQAENTLAKVRKPNAGS